MRVIAFKVWGDFGHFRRHYTTSSPLTHSLPSPSALRGMVAAFLGIPRNEYPEKLSLTKCRFGVRLLNPVKKIRLGINYLDTKDGSWVTLDLKRLLPVVKKSGTSYRFHTPLRAEYLKDPCFEIYFTHEDQGLLDELKARLRARRPVFIPYLGISECLANFEFRWDEELELVTGPYRIVSAFRQDIVSRLYLEEGVGLVKETMPVFIDEKCRRCESVEAVFTPQARALRVELTEAYAYPGHKEQALSFLG